MENHRLTTSRLPAKLAGPVVLVLTVLLIAGCDDSPPASPEATPPPVPSTPATPAAPVDPAAPATPSPIATPPPTPAAGQADADAPAADPIDMYDLDYDEENDRFLVVGTRTGYTGPVYSVYDDGTKEEVGALKDGVENGPWVSYYEDGTKESEGTYVAGLEDGPWSYFYENGQLESSGLYDNGSLVGRWTGFFDNGKIDSDGIYVDGLMDGEWKFYDQATGEERVLTFNQGRETGR